MEFAMRWLGLVSLVAVAACAANPPSKSVWEKPDGTVVGANEMQAALIACGEEMADRVYFQQTPVTLGSEAWVQQNWQIQDSPAYGLMSKPEVNVCLHSFGYNRVVEAVGEGSSTPPALAPAATKPPYVTTPATVGGQSLGLR
jgi:hypothetical protein